MIKDFLILSILFPVFLYLLTANFYKKSNIKLKTTHFILVIPLISFISTLPLVILFALDPYRFFHISFPHHIWITSESFNNILFITAIGFFISIIWLILPILGYFFINLSFNKKPKINAIGYIPNGKDTTLVRRFFTLSILLGCGYVFYIFFIIGHDKFLATAWSNRAGLSQEDSSLLFLINSYFTYATLGTALVIYGATKKNLKNIISSIHVWILIPIFMIAALGVAGRGNLLLWVSFLGLGMALAQNSPAPILYSQAITSLVAILAPLFYALRDKIFSITEVYNTIIQYLFGNSGLEESASYLATRFFNTYSNRYFFLNKMNDGQILYGYSGEIVYTKPSLAFTAIVKEGFLSYEGEASQPLSIFEHAMISSGLVGVFIMIFVTGILLYVFNKASTEIKGIKGIIIFFLFYSYIYLNIMAAPSSYGFLLQGILVPLFVLSIYYLSKKIKITI